MARLQARGSRWSPPAIVAIGLLAWVFALGNACGGSQQGALSGPGGPPTGSQSAAGAAGDAGSDAGDAGADAGDAGADAGPCVPVITPPINAAFDNRCRSYGPVGAHLTVVDGGCAATLTIDSPLTCTGTLAGPADAFTAVCKGLLADLFCSSAATPGVLGCQQADGGGACSIRLCDTTAGTCGP